MTKENLALIIDGCKCYDIPQELIVSAKENGLVIIFGCSDDLCELRGAICDEFDCYDGGVIYCKELPQPITAVWCPEGKECSWAYETEMPHATYRMYDDDVLYCIGIIIDLKETAKKEESLEDKHHNESMQMALYSDELNEARGIIRDMSGFIDKLYSELSVTDGIIDSKKADIERNVYTFLTKTENFPTINCDYYSPSDRKCTYGDGDDYCVEGPCEVWEQQREDRHD